MARAITMLKDLPPYAVDTVERVINLGFGWRFIEEQSLGDKHVQVRDTKYLAPPREVSQYAQALKRGDQMPPVIQTRDRYIVDGNTRTEAARRAGWHTFPTVQLDVNYEDAPEPIRRQIMALGTAFNLTHGRGLNQANIINLIEQVTEDDDRPSDVAAKLHIPQSTVTMAMNARKARDRAERLGITLTGVLSNSQLKTFGQKSDKFTGPVFSEMISLAQDARFSIAQANELFRKVEEADTEGERLTLLTSERAQYRDTIETYVRDGNAPRVTPSNARKLRQFLGFLNNTDPQKLVEVDVRERSKHLRTLTESRDNLEKVIALQMEVERAAYERD